jgi:selenocysteine lyase/cysteine desulfurase
MASQTSQRAVLPGRVITTLPDADLARAPGASEPARQPEFEPARRPEFLAAYPGYPRTAVLDRLRAEEYGYLDAHGQVYLDYTGAGLPAQAQLAAHVARVGGRCFGNPHSESPTSAASTELIERARRQVLDYFRAPPEEYAVIFTPNATAACRLVAEAYPFGPRSRLVLTYDNHNSVNGMREFARMRGAVTDYVPFTSPDLRISDDTVAAALGRSRPAAAAAASRVIRSGVTPWAGRGRRARRQRSLADGWASDPGHLAATLTGRAPGRRGLFAYPAQSNFTGVQHPLRWIETAHQRGYDVLLDAAAFVPANRLDLSVVKPDFVPVSWYKVFGYPTGVGCLIARREALARLWRPWFAGGTIKVVSVQGDWHVLAGDETRFEDGTLNFLHIPDVEVGLSWVRHIGVAVIHERVMCLTGWMLGRLAGLRHSGGEPMVTIYGPAGPHGRGGTVAFNLLDPGGRIVDERAVARDTAAAGISVRTGCFCNPGAGEGAFGITRADVTGAFRRRARTVDEYVDALGLSSGGAIRASVGLASNLADVERFLSFLEATYRDRPAEAAGLAPRLRC